VQHASLGRANVSKNMNVRLDSAILTHYNRRMNNNLDPDKLRIPAYLRKKVIVRQSRQKLILTALDRKQAGLDVHSTRALAPTKPLKKVKEKTYSNIQKQPIIKKARATSFPATSRAVLQNFSTLNNSTTSKNSTTRHKSSQTNSLTGNRFLGDLFRNNPKSPTSTFKNTPRHSKTKNSGFEAEETTTNQNQHQAPTGFIEIHQIGHITTYFDKIQVAVIELHKPLRVGDIIQITADGMLFQQPVDSMQINRKPVKIAKKGSEIGLKVSHKPQINGPVYKVQI